MEKEKYNGIELLQLIKENKLENNTIIKIEMKTLSDNETVLIGYLRLKDNELEWKPKTFRLSMLIDDTYIYSIVDKTPLIEALNKMDISPTFSNHILRYIDSLVYNID